MTANRCCLPVVLAGFAVANVAGAEGRDDGRATAISIGAEEMSCYRRSAAGAGRNQSGDLGAAQTGIAGLEGLPGPRGPVVVRHSRSRSDGRRRNLGAEVKVVGMGMPQSMACAERRRVGSRRGKHW
ncbi:MAG: hypothetical protein OXH15_16340 [Gammaproteobacteria bacterium]|nr:hypothetical protein [Gammaproteobacteria bacterium]